MRVSFDGVRAGDALDLRPARVDARTVADAVRNPADDRVRCPAPGPVHRRVGYVHPDVSVPLVTALAAAARSNGARAPQDAALREARRRRGRVEVTPVDLAAPRRAVAEASAEVATLRDRVARLGGRVEASRERGTGVDDAEGELRAAATRLSEVETERVAARQRLAAARERARDARDARERRRRLGDRADNLARAARNHLAREWHGRFVRAVRAVPGDADPGAEPAAYAGDPATAALAVVRLAAMAAPAVVSGPWFERADDARARLRAPVLLA